MNEFVVSEIKKFNRLLELGVDIELPDNELRKEFIVSVDWLDLSSEQKLTEYFMREFINELDIDSICKYQKLTESFMTDNEDKLNWQVISEFQTFTRKFMTRHKNKLEWIKMPKDKRGYRGIY